MGILGIEVLTGNEEELENSIFAHIVDRGNSEHSAETIILMARINGTPVTALCGYRWVPSRDPQKYNVCPKCLEIYEFAKDFRGV